MEKVGPESRLRHVRGYLLLRERIGIKQGKHGRNRQAATNNLGLSVMTREAEDEARVRTRRASCDDDSNDADYQSYTFHLEIEQSHSSLEIPSFLSVWWKDFSLVPL